VLRVRRGKCFVHLLLRRYCTLLLVTYVLSKVLSYFRTKVTYEICVESVYANFVFQSVSPVSESWRPLLARNTRASTSCGEPTQSVILSISPFPGHE